MAIRPEISSARISRARTAIGKGILYKLGYGGTDPKLPLPTNGKYCDCSGFIAWVLGIKRSPKPTRNWWIETTMMCNDAKSGKPTSTFVKLPEAEPGCLVAYPDRVVRRILPNGEVVTRIRQGHVAIVTAVTSGRITCIDCGAGNGGTTVEAIRERDLTELFLSRGGIFITLRQDL